MSIHLTNAVWRNAMDLSGSKLLVMLALADAADDEGTAWPSMAALANKARLSVVQTRRVVAFLETNGYLSRTLRPGRSPIYHVNLARIGLAPGQDGDDSPIIYDRGTPRVDAPPTPRAKDSSRVDDSPRVDDTHPSRRREGTPRVDERDPSRRREPEPLKKHQGTVKESSTTTTHPAAGPREEEKAAAAGGKEVVVAGDDISGQDENVWQALEELGVWPGKAREVVVGFNRAAGRPLEARDVRAWGNYLAHEQARGRNVGVGLAVRALEAGRTVKEEWYPDADPVGEVWLASDEVEMVGEKAMPRYSSVTMMAKIAERIEAMDSDDADDGEAGRWWRELLAEMHVSYGGRLDRVLEKLRPVSADFDAGRDEIDFVVACPNEVVRAQVGRMVGQMERRLERIAGRRVALTLALAAEMPEEVAA